MSLIRVIAPSEHRRMPWRNGGGVTTEILVEPPVLKSSDARFLYRLSIAEVASDGPFSRFEGYDRHIMLLDGAGMTLDCGSNGRIALTQPLDPKTFSGDWDVDGTLVDGPVHDFNFIVDRARAKASLEVVRAAQRIEADTCILHILSGPSAGDTFVAENELEVPAGVTAASVRLFRS